MNLFNLIRLGLVTLGLSSLSQIAAYSSDLLNTGVWLSGAAYCGKDLYPKMQLAGPAEGFVYTSTLYDVHTDLQGYIGYHPTKKLIGVVIRGSSSVINWLDDFEVRLVPYTTWPECGCKVHNGFYKSALGVTNKTIEAVGVLKKRFPEYQILVSGHSYGASCSQLLAMELVKTGYQVLIYNYGQPRVGDGTYAGFVNGKIKELYRTVHAKDMVPHVPFTLGRIPSGKDIPPTEGFNYIHSCREIFEDVNGNLNTCSATTCEDPKCSVQYTLIQTNTADHATYLSHPVSCEASIY